MWLCGHLLEGAEHREARRPGVTIACIGIARIGGGTTFTRPAAAAAALGGVGDTAHEALHVELKRPGREARPQQQAEHGWSLGREARWRAGPALQVHGQRE